VHIPVLCCAHATLMTQETGGLGHLHVPNCAPSTLSEGATVESRLHQFRFLCPSRLVEPRGAGRRADRARGRSPRCRYRIFSRAGRRRGAAGCPDAAIPVGRYSPRRAGRPGVPPPPDGSGGELAGRGLRARAGAVRDRVAHTPPAGGARLHRRLRDGGLQRLGTGARSLGGACRHHAFRGECADRGRPHLGSCCGPSAWRCARRVVRLQLGHGRRCGIVGHRGGAAVRDRGAAAPDAGAPRYLARYARRRGLRRRPPVAATDLRRSVHLQQRSSPPAS
jgi:hypothetical protein